MFEWRRTQERSAHKERKTRESSYPSHCFIASVYYSGEFLPLMHIHIAPANINTIVHMNNNINDPYKYDHCIFEIMIDGQICSMKITDFKPSYSQRTLIHPQLEVSIIISLFESTIKDCQITQITVDVGFPHNLQPWSHRQRCKPTIRLSPS